MRPALVLLLLVGCKSAEDKPKAEPARLVVPDKLSGTITRNGAPLALAKCRPGREAAIYVDLVTPDGALRFLAYEGMQLFWNPAPDRAGRGAPLACTKLDRSWGGATRPDGTTYFRGRLDFVCSGDAGAFAGAVDVDCGNISPLERKLLDDGRQRKRDELDPPP